LRLENRIAIRYLKSRNRNSLLSFLSITSVVGIILGVATLIIVISVLTGFSNNLKSKLIGTNSDILITRFDSRPITDIDNFTTKLRSYPIVKGVSPFILIQGILSSKNSVTGSIIKGIDPDTELLVSRLQSFMLSGDNITILNSKDGFPKIILGFQLAQNLDVTIGDDLTLMSPDLTKRGPFGMTPKMKKFTVAGFFDTGIHDYNSSFAYTDLDSLMAFNNMTDAVTGLSIAVKDGRDIQTSATELLIELGYPYWVRDWLSMNKSLLSALELEKFAMFIILTLIIIVASFNIVSMIAITIKDKRKDIAILKSFGANKKFIRNIFIFQGMVIGVVGTISGAILAFILSIIIKYCNIIEIPENIYFSDTIPIDIDIYVYIIVIFASLCITLCASIIPSHLAARIGVIDALRKD